MPYQYQPLLITFGDFLSNFGTFGADFATLGGGIKKEKEIKKEEERWSKG